jgi:hypothetical protein
MDDEERHTVDCSINNKKYEKQRMERAIEDDVEVYGLEHFSSYTRNECKSITSSLLFILFQCVHLYGCVNCTFN